MQLHGSLSWADIMNAQMLLKAKGFDPGPLDGVMGPKTIAAIKAFQKANGLVVDGIIGPQTSAKLVAPKTTTTTAIASAKSAPVMPLETPKALTDNSPLPGLLPSIGSGVSYPTSGGSALPTGSVAPQGQPSDFPPYVDRKVIAEPSISAAVILEEPPQNASLLPLLLIGGAVALFAMR